MVARRKGGVVGAALLATVLASNIAAASPQVCGMRLSIELTPDVPDPPDSGFLSSLLNNQVSYRLTLLGRESGSVLVAELAGPGPEYRCRNVIDAMRKDGRVLSIHLDPDTALDLRPPELRSLDVVDLQQIDTAADSDAAETEAVTIAAAPLALEEKPDARPSVGGFASINWAARHPAQAWRVFLPIQPDGYDLSPDSPFPLAHNPGG